MKGSIKMILIIPGSIIGVVILFIIIGVILMSLETGKMNPCETREVIPGIIAVKDGFVNLYLIKGREKYIAVDAGTRKKNITAELQKLNIDVHTILAVFLTHSDYDHAGGVEVFTNAKVYLPEAEEQMINGKTARFFFIYKNTLTRDYELINDGQTIEIEGLRVRSIAAPGHTPGSVCYLIDDIYLFTGDNLSLKHGKAGIFSYLFNMDSKTQIQSLLRLKELKGIEYMFTGHYGFSSDFHKVFEDFN